LVTQHRLIEARRKKRKTLPEKLLVKLYKDERLRVEEITERFNISHASLYQSLELYNIPKRKTEGFEYSSLIEDLLRRLYLEEGLTAREIARNLEQFSGKGETLSEEMTEER
jgi:predicted DNA-binding protein YlxM (UPF0122 family)